MYCERCKMLIPPDFKNNEPGSFKKSSIFDNEKHFATRKRNRKLLLLAGCCLSLIVLVTALSVLVNFALKKPPVYLPCSDGYEFFAASGFCYKTYIPTASRQNALADCESEGGSLASIHSIKENNFVMNLYKTTLAKYRTEIDVLAENSEIWIGQEYDPYEQEYTWSDGTESSFKNYQNGEQNHEKEEFFALVDPSARGKWKSSNELKTASYTCKKQSGESDIDPLKLKPVTINKKCSPGFTILKSTGSCYKAFITHSTFPKATETCAKDGANLVSIHSPEEHADVIKLYKKTLVKQHGDKSFIMLASIWMGLTYNDTTWSWTDGSPVDWSNHREEGWRTPREGQYWTAIEVERSIPQKTINDKWSTVCDPNYFAFVCKKPDTSVKTSESFTTSSPTTTTPPKPVEPKNCSIDYQFFNGFCYKLEAGRQLNFTNARKNCKMEDGDLASIHSSEENQFLIDLIKEKVGVDLKHGLEFFIGLIYVNNRWEWTDGTPVDYSNWNLVEPNFLRIERHTAITYRISDRRLVHGWNNIQSLTERSYFCKKNAE